MKNLTLILFAVLMGMFLIQGCDKTHLEDLKSESLLKVTKTQIVVGEIDTLLLTGVSSKDSIIWAISPDANEKIRYKANAGTITFSAPGTYIVTANKASGLPASVTITVSASPFVVKADTVTAKSDNVTSSTVDTLQLVPITTDVSVIVGYYRNPAGDSVRINLTPYVYLDNNYCRQALLQYKSAITANNNFNLDLINLRESKGCAIATSPSTSPYLNTAAYDVFINKMLGLGTYPLKITVGGVAYTGSIVVTASKITFNWPYTSGVIIPVKVLPQ